MVTIGSVGVGDQSDDLDLDLPGLGQLPNFDLAVRLPIAGSAAPRRPGEITASAVPKLEHRLWYPVP